MNRSHSDPRSEASLGHQHRSENNHCCAYLSAYFAVCSRSTHRRRRPYSQNAPVLMCFHTGRPPYAPTCHDPPDALRNRKRTPPAYP
eukprot:6968639-Prymnesium_polylepis.3